MNLSPNKIRIFFEDLLACVRHLNHGGFLITEVSNAYNWLIAPNTQFPGEPPRRPGERRHLHIRKAPL